MAEKTRNDLRRHRTNMVLLTAVALVFSLMWLPLTILNITADLAHEIFQEGQYNLIHAISLLVAMSSSAINPIIYGWFNSNFRSAFMEILGLSSGEKSLETVEKSKTKLAPPSFGKNQSISALSKGRRKSPRASPKVGHELARPASFSSSSTGKGAVWTHAQYVVEHVEGSPVLKRNVDASLSLSRSVLNATSVDKVQLPNETGCFLSKNNRGSLISYDSIGHRDNKGSPSSYDTCSASERKDKKSSWSSRSVSGCKDKTGSSSSYESCNAPGYKDRKDPFSIYEPSNASEYFHCRGKKGSSSSYETCSISGRNDPNGSPSSYDTCSNSMPNRKDLKSSCSSFDSLFSRKDKGHPSF
ncbi:neuropeptide Y receptor type 1 [Elysia marginata]|uniref:Neuropeptide Y receptor type 1 n=1 Tax=Elysia marginata TaxID=1093978 RepID=A0AAV4H7Z1_9GAST|nr:neuropeptide Y receptor type 1 [Elysia marginata]